MKALILFSIAMLSCAAPVPAAKPGPSPAELQERAWHAQRSAEAAANGCGEPCPSKGDRCQDEYGICYTACAWETVGKDARFLELLRRTAHDSDPTSSFLLQCHKPEGAMDI